MADDSATPLESPGGGRTTEDEGQVAPAWIVNFGTRWSAFVLDAVILFVGQWVLFLVMSRQLQAAGMTEQAPCVENGSVLCEGPSTALWVLLTVMLVVTTLAYHAVFEGRYGATPGKRWMGLRVTALNGEFPIGLTVGLQRSFVRQLPWLLLFLILDASPLDLGLPSWLFMLLLVAALAVLVVGALAPNGLALHDRAARTQVVDARTAMPTGKASPMRPEPVRKRTSKAPASSPSSSDSTSPSPSETEDLS